MAISLTPKAPLPDPLQVQLVPGGGLVADPWMRWFRALDAILRGSVPQVGVEAQPYDPQLSSNIRLGAGGTNPSTNYTLVADDAEKMIVTGTPGVTVTIPAQTVVNFPIGTAISFIFWSSSGSVSIVCGDTMFLAGTVTTGTRTLGPLGMATALKAVSGGWVIGGPGLS